MKPNTLTNLLLLLIAVLLGGIALRPLRAPQAVQAETAAPYPLFMEPGTFMFRAPDGSSQLYGKIAVDLRNGKVWGFPTLGPQPFPVNMVDPKPQTTHPIMLGRFALEDIDR
jgi:hypothetical protein